MDLLHVEVDIDTCHARVNTYNCVNAQGHLLLGACTMFGADFVKAAACLQPLSLVLPVLLLHWWAEGRLQALAHPHCSTFSPQ